MILCAKCLKRIEGAAVFEYPAAYHSYCWHTKERLAGRLGLQTCK